MFAGWEGYSLTEDVGIAEIDASVLMHVDSTRIA